MLIVKLPDVYPALYPALEQDSVVRKFRTTASDEKNYDVLRMFYPQIMVNEPKFLKKFLAISFEKCNFADERYIEKCSFGLEKEKDMMQVGDMKFIDFEETLDRDLGHVGTPKRDEFERNVDILADSESMMKRVAKSQTEQDNGYITIYYNERAINKT